ncbi:hypothetical protein [Enterococcus casseliflavus]|uniref:hypothetical protein n=1 Tax=Enterococcus casseliflavus TaxID=37734 RepID=UPI001BCF77B8|nr:hypothetical protein [Enterococcus casseliflavus]
MLVTTDDVIAAWLSPSRQLSIRVKMNNVTYGSEDITSLSFDSGSISGETYQIGSTYMNSIQIIFPSLIETVKEDMELLPELGVLVNGTYEYTKLGHFFIDEYERNRNNNTTTIKATDKMRFMEGPYESKLSYPRAYKEVALEIANLSGVEVNQNSFASLGIGAINKPVEYTFRQAIGLIAQFEGGFASFNRNGELEIRRLAPTNFEITPESYMLKGFTKNEVSYRIGGISVKTGEEETDVIRVGSTNGSQVQLENKVMTQQLLNQTWELVKDLNYFPYELKWRGCPPLEAGDWIYVNANDGTKYSVPNLSYSITFNGGMSAESKATTSSSSQATYKYRGPLNQRIDYLDSILSSNNWNSNYYDTTEPLNPKEGDIWFKSNGQDREIWIYKNVDGVLDWVMEITSAGDPELLAAIEEAIKTGKEAQLAAKDAKEAADDAKLAGEDAQKVGAEAKAAAEAAGLAAADAKAVGADAKLAAEDAKAVAEDAKLAGEDAQQEAEKAKQAGDNATNLATQAGLDAQAAKEKADAIEINVSGVVSDVASINANVTAVSAKANDAYAKANAVEGRTSTLETSVAGLTGRLTDVENTSTSTTKKLNELVVTVDGQKQTLTTTTTTANSALSKANVLETTVDGVTRTISSLEENVESLPYVGKNNYKTTTVIEPLNNSVMILRPNAETPNGFRATGTSGGNGSFKIKDVIDSDGLWTVSFKMKGNQSTSVYLNLNICGLGSRQIYTTNNNSWKEFSITVDVTNYSADPTVNNYVEFTKVAWANFFIDDFKVEPGGKATPWVLNRDDMATTTKVNTISETVDGHTQLIASTTSTANSALTKATNVETTVNGLKTTVSSVETTANSALTKANSVSSTVDGLTVKISSVETTANAANTKALQVEATTSGLTSTVTQVQTDLNNLSVGGRNYFKNSDVERTASREFVTHSTWDMAPLIDQNGMDVYYTVSFDIKSAVAGNINVYSQNGSGTRYNIGTKTIQVTTAFKRYSYTFKPNSINTNWSQALLAFYGSYDSGRIPTVKNVKFELGNKATDWSPAVEDLATSSQFTQLSDQMNFKLTSSDGGVTQIDMQNKIVTIASENIYLTGKSYISDAIIKTAHIVDLAVSNGKIANLAVTEGKIGNLAVTNAKIASLAVTEGKIGDAAITNAKIGNLAVSEAKIASLAVTEAKVGDAAITNAKIGNLAVSEGKIANLAVTNAKIANLAITETKIGDAAITNAKIGNLAVSTAKIADGAIVNAKIGDAAITNAKIADATISSAKIINLDASKIVANSLAAITTETGTLNVTGWLTMATENRGMMGTYDFGDGYAAAFNYRWFVGDWRLSHRHLVFTGKIYNVTSSNTRGSYLYDAESFYGNDYLKMRQYNSSGKLLNRIDVNSDAITMSNEDWGGASQSIIRSDGTSYFNGRGSFAGLDVSAPNNVGLRTHRIDSPTGIDSFKINDNRAITDVNFGISNIYFNETKTSAADLRIGLDGVGKTIASLAVYNRTYSSAANVSITSSGTLGRSTSASKYKLNISEIVDAEDLGLKLLTVIPKYWFDKSNSELAARDMTEGGLCDIDPITLNPHYGLIAEDLRGAGLDAFISTNYETGEIEGIEYDRLWVTLIPILRKLVESNVLKDVRLNKIERLMEGILNG